MFFVLWSLTVYLITGEPATEQQRNFNSALTHVTVSGRLHVSSIVIVFQTAFFMLPNMRRCLTFTSDSRETTSSSETFWLFPRFLLSTFHWGNPLKNEYLRAEHVNDVQPYLSRPAKSFAGISEIQNLDEQWVPFCSMIPALRFEHVPTQYW